MMSEECVREERARLDRASNGFIEMMSVEMNLIGL